MKKTETMWCITGVDYKGRPYFINSSLSYTRKHCIKCFLGSMDWKQAKKYGWGVKKVSVTIEAL